MAKIVLALCLLLQACAISLGITNSPAPPNSCTGNTRANCAAEKSVGPTG